MDVFEHFDHRVIQLRTKKSQDENIVTMKQIDAGKSIKFTSSR